MKESATAGRRRLLLVLGAGVLVGVLIVIGARQAQRSEPPAVAAEPVRGQPITPPSNAPVAAAENVVASTAAMSTNPPARSRRSKPGSTAQRLVQFQMRLGQLTDGEELVPPAGAPAPKVAVPPTPNIPGYQTVEFKQLAGFHFELSPEVANAVEGETKMATLKTLEQIPAEVLALNGAPVAVSGFVLPTRMEEGLAVEFLLMRDQSLCCYGAVPKINEWISVRTTGRGVKPVLDRPVTVLGKLRVGDFRENGYLTGLYQMEVERIMSYE